MTIDQRGAVRSEAERQAARWSGISRWLAEPGFREVKLEVLKDYTELLKAEGTFSYIDHSIFSVHTVKPQLEALYAKQEVPERVRRSRKSRSYALFEREFGDLTEGLLQGELATNTSVRDRNDSNRNMDRAKIALAKKLAKVYEKFS